MLLLSAVLLFLVDIAVRRLAISITDIASWLPLGRRMTKERINSNSPRQQTMDNLKQVRDHARPPVAVPSAESRTFPAQTDTPIDEVVPPPDQEDTRDPKDPAKPSSPAMQTQQRLLDIKRKQKR